jgi:hypothetical protein
MRYTTPRKCPAMKAAGGTKRRIARYTKKLSEPQAGRSGSLNGTGGHLTGCEVFECSLVVDEQGRSV